ncbi:MAG TPA: hypothetical protein PKW90_24405 [Myxococcota bacterium]|nr:hypothetical protein [Myxococcota bacterium]
MATERRDALEEARRLVVQEGATYDEAAKATGIPSSTLSKRGAVEDWQGQRQHSMSYTAQIRAAKSATLKRFTAALNDEESTADDIAKLGAVWKATELAYPEHRYNVQSDPKARLAIIAEVLEFLPEYLAANDRPLAARLAPHIEPIARALEERRVG